MNNRIIINADDFGRSKAINVAINLAYEQGLITDASIMVTCKEGFDDLVENIKSFNSLLIKGAGCHLCLTCGKPLTNGMLDSNYVVGNEFIDVQRIPKRFLLKKSEREVIFREFQEQVNTIRNKLHIEICHLDSHQHIHFGIDLLPIVVKLCKRENISYLRIPSYSNNLSLKSKIATLLKILYIKINGLKVVDFFGSPNQILASSKKKKNIVEAMVHPWLNSRGEIVNKVRKHVADDCQLLIKEIESLSSYSKDCFLYL